MDLVSSEERRLIDEAVNAGRVEKIPLGQSSFSDVIIFDKESGKLRYKDADTLKRLRSTKSLNPKRSNKGSISPSVAARRRQIRELAAQGKTVPEIVRVLDLPRNTVYNDAKLAGINIRSALPAKA